MAGFLEKALLVSLGDLRRDKGLLPKERGLYGLFFSVPPGDAPTDGCLMREGRWLLYISSAGAGTGSKGTLRNRLGDHHLGGNERRSTLCQTLAALMPEVAGPALARNERGTWKNHTSPDGVQRLRAWMDAQVSVCWSVEPRPGDLEEALVRGHATPLNIDFSEHPFTAVLRDRRAARRAAAWRDIR